MDSVPPIDHDGLLLKRILSHATRAGREEAPTMVSGPRGDGTDRMINHMERYWKKLLHDAFEQEFNSSCYKVLSHGMSAKDDLLGLKEFMYDLTVIKLSDKVAISPTRKVPFPVIEEVFMAG